MIKGNSPLHHCFVRNKIEKNSQKYVIKDEYLFEKHNHKIIQRCISTCGSNTRSTRRKTAEHTWNCFFYCITDRWIWTREIERHRRKRSRRRSQRATARRRSQRAIATWLWAIWCGSKDKIGAPRKTRNRSQGDWKFKWCQHKNDYGYYHTHVKTSTKIIYSYKSEIHRGAGEIMDYSRMLSSPLGMFASLEEIQAYIE